MTTTKTDPTIHVTTDGNGKPVLAPRNDKVTVSVGSTVTWENLSSEPITIIFTNKDQAKLLVPGGKPGKPGYGTWQAPSAAGNYKYIMEGIHQSTDPEIIVEEVG